MDIKLGILILLNVAPPQKFLAPDAIFRWHTVLLFVKTTVLCKGIPSSLNIGF